MKKPILIIGLVILLTLGGFLLKGLRSQPESIPQSNLRSPAPNLNTTGFMRADASRKLSFPEDHGPHPDYQTEWWYYTGNLETPEGRHFGYQLTFFRRALLPPQDRPDQRGSKWATEQIYMAHFALSDKGRERFRSFERFERGAVGLAGANASPFQVWLGNWQIEETDVGKYRLTASEEQIALDLILEDAKGPILQGDQGYSQKGSQPGQASHYYSFTRLISEGTVKIGNESFAVSGLSWMDHEFSTSALSKDQIGWDWFSLQFDDGSELMFFQIRRENGNIDPFSSGTFVHSDGSTQHLDRDDFSISVRDTWRSPDTGTVYPARWDVAIPQLDLELEIIPHLADQELKLSYTYWEGAVSASGRFGAATAKEPIQGNGYVELTGYSESFGGEF